MLETATTLIRSSVSSLKKTAKDPSSTVLQLMLAAVMLRIVETGDTHAFDILMNRMVGKAKEDIRLTTPDASQPTVIILPSNGFETPRNNSKNA